MQTYVIFWQVLYQAFVLEQQILAWLYLLEPLVAQGLRRTDPLLRIFGQHFFQQINCMLANVRPLRLLKLQIMIFYLSQGLFFGGTLERRFAHKKDVQNDACTPNIALFVKIIVDYFGCHVTRSAYKIFAQIDFSIDSFGSSKIN